MKAAVKRSDDDGSVPVSASWSRRLGGLVGWVLVVVAGFFGSQLLVGLFIYGLLFVGLALDLDSALSQLVYRLAVYIVMFAMVAGVIWYRHRRSTTHEAGLSRLPEWGDIGLSLAGVIVYMLCSAVALKLASTVPGFDIGQTQDLSLPHLFGSDLLIAFVVLVVLTPLFEEAIFRGFLYGKLRGIPLPWWFSSLVVSALFGVAHMQWNVGIDVFCLSLVACALREITGSIWAGVLLHMIKNFIAFLFTFVFIFGVSGF